MTIKLPDADQLIKNQHKLNDLGAAMSLVDAEIQKETRTANNKLLESVSHEIKRLGCKFHSDRYPAKCPSGEPSLTMPVRRRIDKRRAEVTDEHEAWLHGDDRAAGFIPYAPDDELAALWAENSERIVAEHVSIYPGTRPHRWWHYSTPRLPLGTFPGCYYDGRLREPRRRLGGIGTPASDVLSYVPTFRYGLPWIWIEQWQVMYYSGLAVDIHGAPIGDLYPREFKGVAIDPNDPPMFESQATYLRRHGLLLAGEERRSDFEPETISA